MFRAAPRRLGAVVAVVVLAITVGLAYLAYVVNAHGEQRLLARQVAQIGTLLSNQAAVLQTELADVGTVAINTRANPGAFARFAARELQQTGQSLSLWRVTGGHATRLAVQGVDPMGPDGGPDALLRMKPDGRLAILGVLHGARDRLSYALMPAGDKQDLVVYAETPLPSGHRLPATPDSPLAGLDVALYLGRTAAPGQLLESTAATPIAGTTHTETIPFGTASVTIVGASPTHLTGALSATLPWIVLGVGTVLAVAGAATVGFVTRRRALAERLAAENERLYRQQRGIAATLQQALLPTVPSVDGVEIAARYVAGVDELDVGGDWYDVIPRGQDCCVFVVGDISGRGLKAAATMASLRFAVRAYVAQGDDIETVLAKLRGLLDIETEHQFATVLLGELDATDGRIRVVSAGHFPPLLVTDRGPRPLDCPVAPPVGVPSAEPVPATTVTVSEPATLLAFSDGLVERRGEVIDAGLERLRTAAGSADSRPLEAMLDDLLGTLAVDGRKDDTVLLGVRWTNTPAGRVRT
jgi:serine phosphatase RsbU (regulator of sigma subunit)